MTLAAIRPIDPVVTHEPIEWAQVQENAQPETVAVKACTAIG